MSAPEPLPGLSLLGPSVVAEFQQAWQDFQQAKLRLWHAAGQGWFTAGEQDRAFVADELAVVMNCHPATGSALMIEIEQAFELGTLVAEWSAGHLSDRHVKAGVAQLHASLDNDHDRRLVLDRVLDACRRRARAGGGWPTPGRFKQMLRVAALLVDPTGAAKRKEQAADERGVSASQLPNGQAMLSLEGPEEQVATMHAAIQARAAHAATRPGETRTRAQLEFDVADELLTRGIVPDDDDDDAVLGTDSPDGRPRRRAGAAPAVRTEIQVVMSLGTATGETDDPGELPDLGPVLASTCRELLSRADTIRRICTDPHTGQVVAVDEAVPVHRDPDAIRAALAAMQSAPVTLPDLASAGYRPTARALRFVRLRDRTCRFPGCTRPARYTDVDHRIPWPLGPTDPRNLHCLCRHHHRAKQSGLFTVHTEPDGSTVWTLTRTGTVHRRPPPALLPTL